MPTVLVIDDNPSVATALDVLFSLHDIDTVRAETPEAGLARLQRGDVDLVLQDMNFHADTTSGEDGIALFHAIRERAPDLPVILLTAWTHLESAVDLVKAGAADYLAKPWDDRKLLATVNNLLELSEARRELARHHNSERRRRDALSRDHDLRGVVYADPASERLLALAAQVARSELPVLVTGPNGAGKEKIAEILHANSAVRDGPLVALNCGALPGELIEAELFGADAGAYTGAGKAREGKFEAADGGTLFLDEIGNLPLAGQVKLLRVLETGRFQRLGSNRERQVRVRVVSATNADLPALIADGRFRQDLYYRLNAIELQVPPLAERPDDILPLARHFLPAGKRLSTDAERTLLRHAWPGNVRELRNAVQRAALLSPHAEIGGDAFALQGAPLRPVQGEEPDRVAIESALARANGVIAQAAADLGLSRQALYRRLDRLGIPENLMRILRVLPLAIRMVAVAVAGVAASAVATAGLSYWLPAWVAAAVAIVLVGLVMSTVVWRTFVPLRALFRALAGTVASYRDGDFSFGITWNRYSDLIELVDSHNALGDVLREQRNTLVQREMMLDTMVQNTPVSMLLVDPTGRIVLGNLAARKLLGGGRKLEGHAFDALLAQAPDALREAFERGGDGMFTVGDDDSEEIYHLSRRGFRLNGRRHELVLLRQLTAELRRQEVQTWKKVIRVISHELNNSLAPIASLAHSGSELLRRGQYERLPTALATIEERARHLEGFIRDYARFAKLPAPRLEAVEWPIFIEKLRTQVAFGIEGSLHGSARIDVAQVEQGLLNLLKNAHESGSASGDVRLALRRLPGAWRIDVLDRGSGMNESVLANALLPFYSTKRNGTGLGLALAREIAEAHGRRIALLNRDDGGLCVSIVLPD